MQKYCRARRRSMLELIGIVRGIETVRTERPVLITGTKEIKKADTVTAKLPKNENRPQTGDSSNFILWIALLFISGGAVIGTAVTEKKKKQK